MSTLKTIARTGVLAGTLGAMLAACAPLGKLSERVATNTLTRPEKVGCLGAGACPDLRSLWIADLHADTLLWQRDFWRPLTRSIDTKTAGHINTRRLVEGGTNLQVFAIATHTPAPRFGGTEAECASRYDVDTQIFLKIQELFEDPSMIASLWHRAMGHIRQFRRWIDDERAGLGWVRSRGDMAQVEASGEIASVLAIEGMHWVHGSPDEIQARIGTLAENGVRMAGLTHRFTNALAGSSEDCLGTGVGLTESGEIAIREMARRGIVLDLAHASMPTISRATTLLRDLERQRRNGAFEAAGRVLRPVVSHGGVHAVCPANRNLRPQSIRDVVMAGGLIAVGYWAAALCWSPEDSTDEVIRRFARSQIAIIDALSQVGFAEAYEDAWGQPLDPFAHVALGSDFDGAVPMTIDSRDVPTILASLEQITCAHLGSADDRLVQVCETPGFGTGPALPLSRTQVAMLAGENFRELLSDSLPE